jgi:aspartyl-tRNA(Asn)/glutamyl-tRNA(Gln) amidotransferase subunit A
LDPTELSVVEAGRLLRRRRLSSEELTHAYLDRIERLQPRLNAFVTVTRDLALQQARAADRELRAGRDRGPYQGIPIGHKDLFLTRGIRTTAGSRILARFVPRKDATVVARLRDGGAVLLGKLQTHEFAYGALCDSPTFGPVRNPWDPARSPGGSSGGTAAALAARLVAAGTGSDTGGSIRIPAAWCGVVGLKPTYGRVSRAGLIPLAPTLDHAGPMGRRVEDVATLFEVITGADPGDPSTAGLPARGSVVRGLRRGVRGLVLGVPREHFFERLDPEVDRLVGDALRLLEGLGARLEPVRLPRIGYAHPAALAIMLAEGTALHSRWFPSRADAYADDVRLMIELGMFVPGPDYVRALKARDLLRGEVDAALAGRVQALIVPTLPVPAVRHGESRVRIGDRTEAVRTAVWRLAHPFNITGHPALQVPVGFTRDELPVGMQIVGAPCDEATVFRVGAAYEAAAGWARRGPSLD